MKEIDSGDSIRNSKGETMLIWIQSKLAGSLTCFHLPQNIFDWY